MAPRGDRPGTPSQATSHLLTLGAALGASWGAGSESPDLLVLPVPDAICEQLLPEALAHADALAGPALVARAAAAAARQPSADQPASSCAQDPPAAAVAAIPSLVCGMLGLPAPGESAPAFRRPPPLPFPSPADLSAAINAPTGSLPPVPALQHLSSRGECGQSIATASCGGRPGRGCSGSPGVEGPTEKQLRQRQHQRNYLKRNKPWKSRCVSWLGLRKFALH